MKRRQSLYQWGALIEPQRHHIWIYGVFSTSRLFSGDRGTATLASLCLNVGKGYAKCFCNFCNLISGTAGGIFVIRDLLIFVLCEMWLLLFYFGELWFVCHRDPWFHKYFPPDLWKRPHFPRENDEKLWRISVLLNVLQR